MALAWLVQRRMQRPVFAEGFALPDRSDLTVRLIGGSALFGIGWGGLPACLSRPWLCRSRDCSGFGSDLLFAAMLAGMVLVRLLERDIHDGTATD